jgi:spermidine/putrescine transport system ATP-binding protein
MTAPATPAPTGELRLESITKRFGTTTVVDDLDLHVPTGELFALLGPSGCGKTTTLRMVAGLEQPDSGRVLLAGVDITGWRSFKRPVNTVFQSYALFPHLNIFDNVAFGLRERRRTDVEAKVEAMLGTVELSGLGRRKPQQLSGGQQQRVALARALVNEPQVLLLDEPLGALDLRLRRQMQGRLKQIQSELGLTFLHVTHDQEEAMTIADTIAVMNHGRIEQMGSPEELYETPRTAFVANFLGSSNLLPARLVETGVDLLTASLVGTTVSIPRSRSHGRSSSMFVGVRPEKLHIGVGTDVPAGHNAAQGIVVDSAFTGIGTEYSVELAGQGNVVRAFEQNLSSRPRHAPGTPVLLHWEIGHTFALDGDEDPAAGREDVVAAPAALEPVVASS